MNVVYSLVLSYFQGNLTKLNFKNSQKLTVVQWGLMLNKLHMCEWEEHLKAHLLVSALLAPSKVF